jgi:hypothetical protein
VKKHKGKKKLFFEIQVPGAGVAFVEPTEDLGLKPSDRLSYDVAKLLGPDALTYL